MVQNRDLKYFSHFVYAHLGLIPSSARLQNMNIYMYRFIRGQKSASQYLGAIKGWHFFHQLGNLGVVLQPMAEIAQ